MSIYVHVCKGKSKVVRVLQLIKPHAKKTYGGVEYRSTYSEPRHWMEASGKFHVPGSFTPG
jgi:hypothetical protein